MWRHWSIDPGYYLTIIAFCSNGLKEGIQTEDLQPPNVVIRNYSKELIAIGARVKLEYKLKEKCSPVPVYVLLGKSGTLGTFNLVLEIKYV